jgi:hypothetical protein
VGKKKKKIERERMEIIEPNHRLPSLLWLGLAVISHFCCAFLDSEIADRPPRVEEMVSET